MRSIPAVTTRPWQWRIAARPATSSQRRMITPPCTKPAVLASVIPIQRVSTELVSEGRCGGTRAHSTLSRVGPAAVAFDLDGVLIDSEGVWNEARREVALAHGGHWDGNAQRAMMGMSSTEWSRYMHEQLAVELAPERISDLVVAGLLELYRQRLPLLPGAVEAVRRARRGVAAGARVLGQPPGDRARALAVRAGRTASR